MSNDTNYIKYLIYEFYKCWNKMDQKERLTMLQLFENENAKLQGRMEREVVITNRSNKNLHGSYNTCEPEYINVNHLPDIPSNGMERYEKVMPIGTVFHEGIHAHVHDILLDKAPCETFMQNVNKTLLSDEYTMIESLAHQSLGKQSEDYEKIMKYFNACKRYEEQVARKESMLFFAYNYLDIAKENINFNLVFREFFIELEQYKTYLIALDNPPYSEDAYKTEYNNANDAINYLDKYLNGYKKAISSELHPASNSIVPKDKNTQENAKRVYSSLQNTPAHDLLEKGIKILRQESFLGNELTSAILKETFKDTVEQMK